jgi:hypothetical protein
MATTLLLVKWLITTQFAACSSEELLTSSDVLSLFFSKVSNLLLDLLNTINLPETGLRTISSHPCGIRDPTCYLFRWQHHVDDIRGRARLAPYCPKMSRD